MDTVGQDGRDVGMTQLLSTSNDDPGTPSDVAPDSGPQDGTASSGTVGAPGRGPPTLPFQPSSTQMARLAQAVKPPLGDARKPWKAIRPTQQDETPEVSTPSQQRHRQLEYAKESKVGHEIPFVGPTATLSSSMPPGVTDRLPVAAELDSRPLPPVFPSTSPLHVQEEHFSVPESSSEEQRILPRPRNPVAAPPGLRRLEEGGDGAAAPAVDAVVGGAGFRRLSLFARTLLLAGATVSLVAALLAVVTWRLFQEPLGFDVAYNASRHFRLLAPLARGSGNGDVADSNDSLVAAGTSGAVGTAAPPAAPLGGFEDAAPLF